MSRKRKSRKGYKPQKRSVAYSKQNQPKFPGRNRHHIIPRCRGGSLSFRNLLIMNIEKHHYWHTLFGLLTIDEVIQLLTRVQKCKQIQKHNNWK